MGTDFYWFYDILLIGIICVITFSCYKKGFISSVVGLVAFIVSLGAALILSPYLSEAVYDALIKKNVTAYLDEKLGDKANIFSEFSQTDTENITISGKNISELDISFDPSGKTMIDLKNVNLSKTGIEYFDLSMLSTDFNLKNKDLDNLDLGKIIITLNDVEKYNINDLIFAKALIKLYGGSNVNIITSLSDTLSDFSNQFPLLDRLVNIDSSTNALNHAIITLINSNSGSLSEVVADEVIKPTVINPIRLIIFLLLFFLFQFVLGIFSRTLKVINRIPVIGTLNSILGAVMGILQSMLILFILAILLNIITTITGNTIVFINNTTINNTILFKYIYNFDFLNLSGNIPDAMPLLKSYL